MIKIAALNRESEEESGSEEEVTKEALEQIALQQYAKALELQRKGQLGDATRLLKDLLDTELLDGVKKPATGEKIIGPLFNLKYLCYKNLASMLSAGDEVDEAIEAYTAAAELDDTDVTLWHRLGLLCMKAARYEMALQAFQRGTDRNPKHWPCLDKIVTLLLGLDYKEECISTIYDAFVLDPGYMRGLVYRKHIYTSYPHVREFLEYLNPMYKWDEKDDDPVDEEIAIKLLEEAKRIDEKFTEQHKAEQIKDTMPVLKLVKPITRYTWESVGEALTCMHDHMTENCHSYACHLEVVVEIEEKEQTVEVIDDIKETEPETKSEDTSVMDIDKIIEIVSENEHNDVPEKEKGMDIDKVDSDIEVVNESGVLNDSGALNESGAPNDSGAPNEYSTETTPEPKKKQPGRRRGSDLSFLQQWEWCNKRRSGRKKPVNRQDHLNDNIYDTLRKMVPLYLNPEAIQKDEEDQKTENNVSEVEKINNLPIEEKKDSENYFGSEAEQNDVQMFIDKYMKKRHDIIDLIQEFLQILAKKWRKKWSDKLKNIFIAANKCYANHIDTPSCTDEENYDDVLHYVAVNLLAEEILVNEKINSAEEEKQRYDPSKVECIGIILSLKPHFFSQAEASYSVNNLELVLRHLWVKLHVFLLNKSEEVGLECLYQLIFEFEGLREYQSTYNLPIVNFTFKPTINYHEITEYIQFLERNKKLSTVLDLYERGEYNEVLSIVIDSFEHCKDMAREQEDEMSLDFAVQLSVILDAYWALDDVNNCLIWSFICLHEALKHYFRFTSGSSDYEKWTLTVVKILSCIEHLISTKDLSVLSVLSRKDLSRGLEDIIRIIGHQVETNTAEMPFHTVIPWIIMHFILQREEDLGRGKTTNDKEAMNLDDVPNPLMVLFIAHEQLGNRGWCCQNDGKLLYFILDTVVPRLRSPSLSKSLEQVCQHMEQIVYCLYGHPNRKHKLKYLIEHNVTPHGLDWERAQQVYEIFRPPSLPPLEGKISGISADTEQLFLRILALLPTENDPRKYIPEVEKYVKGTSNTLPSVSPLLPYRMRDIYFLLGDYYFKKEEGQMVCKYNVLDVIINSDRFEAWAELSLAKAVNLERILNSCKNLNNEKDVLNPAKAIIRCFKRALELEPTHCNMWIEYGMFVYSVHSFCSRMLKQASESLSMEEFEVLEKQKERMLDTTHKCFTTVLTDLNSSNDTEKSEDSWLNYYMLGKVAEKRNKPPEEYLNHYMQGVKSLQETDATYPLKINYNSPTHLCIEVLELHYRIHASILKYIEQHENKPIPSSVGKTFANCIEEWQKGPFSKKSKKDGSTESENETKTTADPADPAAVHAANIFKRSISDAGEGETQEAKRLKTESAAAKIRRSASYDTERLNKDQTEQKSYQPEPQKQSQADEVIINADEKNPEVTTVSEIEPKISVLKENEGTKNEFTNIVTEKDKLPEEERKAESSSSASSSSSSSGSSSSDSSSDSTSESSRDSEASTAEKSLSDEEIMKIVSACLDALEDCASRFPPHYKAIYRLAHYHFYYKKGKDIERCRDLMLSSYTSRAGPKLGGMFSERKVTNFFNNIWKIPLNEVDRAGSFAFHMNRSVLLTMEILKEIDDHKTLLDLSLHLQRIPEPDKKYLRDSDREDLAQQAFSLCVQSLKGQLLKFSQQADLKSNEVERKALKSLMLDIYRAYQRVQKQSNSKQFTNLLIDAYKLVCSGPITENMNLVDLSMKYCQSLIMALKQQATQASLDKNQTAQKKQTVKSVPTSTELVKPSTSNVNQPKADKAPQVPASSSSSGLPKMSAQDMAAAFQNFLPVLNDPLLSHQTAAALSYLSNFSALAGYSGIQNNLQPSLQNSLQNSFQAEFYRQFLSQSMVSYNLPPTKPKQKRGPKPGLPRSSGSNAQKSSKPFTPIPIGLSKSISATSLTNIPGLSKSISITSTSALPKSTSMSSASGMAGIPKSTSISSSTVLPSFSKTTTVSSSYAGLSKSTSMSAASSLPKTQSASTMTSFGKPTLTASRTTDHPKPTTAPFTPSMGTVLPSLPASMTANLTSFGASHTPSARSIPTQAHKSSSSTLSTAMYTKPIMPQLLSNPGKTLQEKLAERQKNMPPIALSKLPSSLTITKTSVNKSSQSKKPEAKKTESAPRPKPIDSNEVIVLDDD